LGELLQGGLEVFDNFRLGCEAALHAVSSTIIFEDLNRVYDDHGKVNFTFESRSSNC